MEIIVLSPGSLQRLIKTIPRIESLDKDSILVVGPVAGPCHSREVTLLFGYFLYSTLQHPTRTKRRLH